MNYIDLLLGLGAGVLVTLIVTAIKRSKEEKEKEEKAKYYNISERFRTIENKQSDFYFENVDLRQRIEKLEKRK